MKRLAVLLMLCGFPAVPFAQDAPDIFPAAKAGKVQSVADAVKAGASVNSQDEHGATPLMWASLRGYKDVVTALLGLKADPNIADNRGQTALIWAAMRGKTDIVKQLIASGADSSKKDLAGKTAADIAVENGYHDIASLFKTPAPQLAKPVPKTVPSAAAGSTAPKHPENNDAAGTAVPEAEDTAVSLKDYYPARIGDRWIMTCQATGIVTTFYVLDASEGKAVLQGESKKKGSRVDFYKQTMTFAPDALRAAAYEREEILLKLPLKQGEKWFIEKNNSVIERQLVLVGEKVSFSGKEYACVVTRDIISVGAEPSKRRGASKAHKEVHYHCYAKGVGYLGTKTASFAKAGDVEHIPSFAEITDWYLVRQRSEN